MDFPIVLAASAAVNRFVEAVKPFVRKTSFSAEIQDGLLVVIAVLAGVATALMGGLSLFVAIPSVPAFGGLLLTGAIIGLGADAIHIVVDLLYGWRDNVRPVDGVAQVSVEPVTATAEVTVG